VVGNVAKALDRIDPANAKVFDPNAAAYEASLRDLDAAYETGLATCDRNVIVTSHAAFGYLSTRYGLQQVPISGLSPDAEPSPADLSRLIEIVREKGITTIFTEELLSPKVAQTIAAETGTTTAVLNPLESLTDAEVAAGESYVSVMHTNLQTLRTALGCH
jgi:zinc transport system substrate-binding protein